MSESKSEIETGPRRPKPTRRQFIKAAAGAGAAVVLSVIGAGRAPSPDRKLSSQPSPSAPISPVAPATKEIIPQMMEEALRLEFGNYERLVSWDEMLDDFASANFVAVGETHVDIRDMKTARDILETLAKKRPVALAVERFSYKQQPQLDALLSQNNKSQALNEIFKMPEYSTVWGDQAPMVLLIRSEFESLVLWAADSGIPIIGLDVSLQERKSGATIAQRNDCWATQVTEFRMRNPNVLVISIGGEEHMSNDPDSYPNYITTRDSLAKVLATGQRSFGWSGYGIRKIEDVAQQTGSGTIIVKKPQYANAFPSGDTIQHNFNPRDYWIAVKQ